MPTTSERLAALAGLERAKNIVTALATGDHAAHAVLFYGPRGVGKGTLARALAQAWMCKEPGSDGACGVCAVCGAVDREASPDLLVIEPWGKSDLIKVDAINESKKPDDKERPPVPVRRYFQTGPLAARRKVVILEQVHRMNGEAANALLKTLEEPFPYARILLTTDMIGSVLPTIRSRCLAVACTQPESPAEAIEGALERLLSDGSPGRAKTIAAHRELYMELARLAETLPARPPAEALVASEQLRDLAERIAKARNLGARAAMAETLEVFALAVAGPMAHRPEWRVHLAEAHRKILGNGQSGLVLDGLFARLAIPPG